LEKKEIDKYQREMKRRWERERGGERTKEVKKIEGRGGFSKKGGKIGFKTSYLVNGSD